MRPLSKLFLPILLLLPLVTACNNDDDDRQQSERNVNCNDYSQEPALQRLEFPRVKGGSSIVVIHNTNDQYGINYSIEWDCQRKSQRWSCYQIHSGNSGGKNSRVVDGYLFDEDLPDSKKNYVTDKYGENYDPFWSSGYSHGHICPNADRKYSKEANRQTFFLTNMQPQKSSFNGGLWKKMEEKVRAWTPTNGKDTLYIVKGGTIDSPDQIIEYISNRQKSSISQPNFIPVPKYFFMALLRKYSMGYKALAFWAEHLDEDHSSDPLASYIINIRELERRTGIDFFCNLPDNIEEEVETTSIENIKWLWDL